MWEVENIVTSTPRQKNLFTFIFNFTTMDKTQQQPQDTDSMEKAYRQDYLKGLNERAIAELGKPDTGEEPYPDGQHGAPVAQDPFFLPEAYSVWD